MKINSPRLPSHALLLCGALGASPLPCLAFDPACPAFAPEGLVEISIPPGSQNLRCAPVRDGIWTMGIPFSTSRGAGVAIRRDLDLANDREGNFILHMNGPSLYVAEYVPDPARAAVAYTFSAPLAVRAVEIWQHGVGVTAVEGFAILADGQEISLGTAQGPRRGEPPVAEFEGEPQVFDFQNHTLRAERFKLVVRRTSLDYAFAAYRVFPLGPDLCPIPLLATNTPPRFNPAGPVAAVTGDEIQVDLSATDADEPAQRLRFSLANPPPGMAVEPETGRLRWTAPEVSGEELFHVVARVVDDGEPPQSAELGFDIRVAAGVTPELGPDLIPWRALAVGQPVSVPAPLLNPPADRHRFNLSLLEGPAGARLEAGNLLWTPQSLGRHRFTLRAQAIANPAAVATRAYEVEVAPRFGAEGLVQISIPQDSQNLRCAPSRDGVWTTGIPFSTALGAGVAVSRALDLANDREGNFILHMNGPSLYVEAHAPNPDRAVVTYAFSAPAAVRAVEIWQHAVGVTAVEGFAILADGQEISLGTAQGPRQGEPPVTDYEGQPQLFDFGNSALRAERFKLVVRRTSLDYAFAAYRIFPLDAALRPLPTQAPRVALAIERGAGGMLSLAAHAWPGASVVFERSAAAAPGSWVAFETRVAADGPVSVGVDPSAQAEFFRARCGLE